MYYQTRSQYQERGSYMTALLFLHPLAQCWERGCNGASLLFPYPLARPGG
jgi:hypothetical protein